MKRKYLPPPCALRVDAALTQRAPVIRDGEAADLRTQVGQALGAFLLAVFEREVD